jgi:glutathione synthase/RimK-type ligase-like ATP-grasp enzyme
MMAEERGIALSFIPFHKAAYAFDRDGYSLRSVGKDYTETLRDAKVVLNRTQSKNRRIVASAIVEGLGKYALNPLGVELFCQSKMRTLLELSKQGILTPKTAFVSCNALESTGGGPKQDNGAAISKMIRESIGEAAVVKPDAGTHGNGVVLARGDAEIQRAVAGYEPSVINPVGMLAQEPISKWFYDMRIIVYKRKGEDPVCHADALARGGFKELRTNTFLGNMVFRAHLPAQAREAAAKSAAILGEDHEAWVIGMDAMPCIPSEMMEAEQEIRGEFQKLDRVFQQVLKVKQSPTKKTDFASYTRDITAAYTAYTRSEPYERIKAVINETLSKTADRVYFHEGNACPEFWEQTRVVAGINPAVDLLECAESIIK